LKTAKPFPLPVLELQLIIISILLVQLGSILQQQGNVNKDLILTALDLLAGLHFPIISLVASDILLNGTIGGQDRLLKETHLEVAKTDVAMSHFEVW